MTLPFPDLNLAPSYAASRTNWLGRYLGLEKKADRALYQALTEATEDIDAAMLALVGKTSKTAATRRLQMALAHKQIRAIMNELFGKKIAGIISTSQSEAAAAAVDAALVGEKRLLRKIFATSGDANEYAKSLRASARKNIDATMTRVLDTKLPLSKRVWKARAQGQGMIDRVINSGLARGDSFEQIARSVRTLVRPDVPGGVTYAAKRLARTEINNAFHAQSIRDAQEMPWVVAMRWNLSKRHMDDPGDPCERFAQQGTFITENVPDKPHPHCRCFVTPEPVSDAAFDYMLDSGQIDNYLDDFISGG